MQFFSAELTKKIQLTTDMVELHFSKSKGFHFTAGQFVQIDVPAEPKNVFRSYSLASTPADESIEFCVKYLENGKASNFFKSLEIGEEIRFRGPVGHFVVDNDEEALTFIATGSGLAPIMGMIRDELENKKSQKNIHLVFGVRYEQDVFWIDRLEKLASTFDNFTYKLSLSRAPSDWSGFSGRVNEHIDEDVKGRGFYICGSGGMVKDVRTLLINRGVDLKNIHLEIF